MPGPLDILTDGVGAMAEDLARAIDAARYCDRTDCAAYAASFSWEDATLQFLAGLVPLAYSAAEADIAIEPDWKAYSVSSPR